MSSSNLPSPPETIELFEYDQANNLIATYLKTSSYTSFTPQNGDYAKEYFKSSFVDERKERIDVVVQKKRSVRGYGKSLLGAFLPVGYPESVSEDYLEYQIYDSLQAFSSSIAGMLSSRAVLEGIGVGSTHTTPTNALLLTILQESLGRIATVLFASRLGPSLEAECKFYRLAADVFNDAAMIFDCLSPALPTTQRVLLLSCSGILRALCGIAAGSSKASLSLHFARKGNVADLAAKDSSQETIISLLGMLAGSIVITHITTPRTTWIALLFLLSIHLYTNYRAVRAVRLNTLNQQRANILFSHFVASMAVPDPPGPRKFQTPRKNVPPPRLPGGINCLNPEEVSKLERIFTFRDGVLRSKTGAVTCTCHLGVTLSTIFSLLPKTSHHASTGSYNTPSASFSLLLEIFKELPYILYYSAAQNRIVIAVKEHSQQTYLQAWFHAFLLLEYLNNEVLRDRVDGDFSTYHGWGRAPGEEYVDRKGYVKCAWNEDVDEGEDEVSENEGGQIAAQLGLGSRPGKAERREKQAWKALLATASYVQRQWGNVEGYLEEEGWDLEAEAMVCVAGRSRFKVKRDGEDSGDEKGGSDSDVA